MLAKYFHGGRIMRISIIALITTLFCFPLMLTGELTSEDLSEIKADLILLSKEDTERLKGGKAEAVKYIFTAKSWPSLVLPQYTLASLPAFTTPWTSYKMPLFSSW